MTLHCALVLPKVDLLENWKVFSRASEQKSSTKNTHSQNANKRVSSTKIIFNKVFLFVLI